MILCCGFQACDCYISTHFWGWSSNGTNRTISVVAPNLLNGLSLHVHLSPSLLAFSVEIKSLIFSVGVSWVLLNAIFSVWLSVSVEIFFLRCFLVYCMNCRDGLNFFFFFAASCFKSPTGRKCRLYIFKIHKYCSKMCTCMNFTHDLCENEDFFFFPYTGMILV